MKRKIISGIIALSMISGMSAVAADAAGLGDVNNDGNIDIEDAVAIINHVNGVTPLSDDQELSADVDKSGVIDIEDAVKVISHINGVSPIDEGDTLTSDITEDSSVPEDESGPEESTVESQPDSIVDDSSTPDSQAEEDLSISDNDYGLFDINAPLDEKSTSADAEALGYLTPQTFGAKGDGTVDDTQAFRDMFKAAYDQGFPSNPNSDNPGWRHTKAIFIPSGTYNITGAIIDDSMGIRYGCFEVCGAGRESTRINFTGDILIDTRINDQNDNRVIIGFTTFRDIEFKGNNNNTFMNMVDCNDHKSDGVQRLQFISCSFNACNKIIETLPSRHMLSEVTFAYCKIADCGTDDNPCRLFTLDCSQAMNWRFDFTDIEGFHGDAFYYKRGANVYVQGGSIIPMRGTVFNFDFPDSDRRNTAGESNSPHLCCDGCQFEIKYDLNKGYESTLLKTNSIMKGAPNVVFRSCKIGTVANNSPHCLDIQGAADIFFDNCYDVSHLRISGDVSANLALEPRIKFVNCSDVNVDYLVENSNIKSATGGLAKNNVRIMVDNSYDFYLADKDYYRTVSELNECRQVVKLGSYNNITLSNGKTVSAKPYGRVKYVEFTVSKSDVWKAYPVTVTLYDGSKQLGEPVKLDFSANSTYMIAVNDDVNEVTAKFTHSYSQNPDVNMNMEIVKY